ncbi:MAG TPA: AMP-binding protein [Polyangiaceae bacterium]|nr:AMP-binding protein [Polyangiaceae bacterium]
MSTLSIFDAAREAPDALALIDGSSTLSFRQAAERCAPLAQALLQQRTRALALTPRADTESLLWLYAAFATGTPVLTLHTRATAAERHAAIERCGATEPPPPAPTGVVPGALPVISDANALAFIPTSGSTGTPRLVELSRGAVVASAEASAQNLGWEPNDRWLLCLPLAHTGGLSIVLRCLLARRTALLFEPGPSGVLAQLDALLQVAQRATLMSLVPSVLSELLDAGFAPAHGLRAVLVGGAGCSPALAQRAHTAQVPLLTSYGLTETASQVVTRRYGERFDPLPERDGVVSSGHPLPGVELRFDAETLAIRSPSLFSGYLGEASSGVGADGFLRTTDRGELGKNGELYVRGRSDDVIISGGENVDPLEVEAALLSLPGVKAACVFGSPSARFGQVVSAVLVSANAALAEPSHLAELLADRLARHKLPRRALLAQNLPLTLAGKIDRRAVRDQYAAKLADPDQA